MEKLIEKLNAISDSYSGFVSGIASYAKKKPERLKVVLEYLESNDNLTVSDVTRFVFLQPDFQEDVVPVKREEIAS